MEGKSENDSYSDENKLTSLSKIFYDGFLSKKEICYGLSSYKERNFVSLKEMKKVMLKDFIKTIQEPNKTKYCQVSDRELEDVIINPRQLDYIFAKDCYLGNHVSVNLYYKPNSTSSENFDEKFQELKENYGGENISPTAAICFLSAIKKNDLTTERFEKVVSAVNIGKDYFEDFYRALWTRIFSLIESLNQNTFMPDQFVDIIAFFAKTYFARDYDSYDWQLESPYKTIYYIIINSKDYKNARGNTAQETDAIKKVLDPYGFCKNLWITLSSLQVDELYSYVVFSKWLITKKIQEQAQIKYGNEYSRAYAKKLNDLLVTHDIYISSKSEWIKGGYGTTIISIKTESYKKIKQQTQNDFNAIMKNVINDFEKDNIVRYDWCKGTISYNKKTYQIQDEKIDGIRKVVTQICQDKKDFFCKSGKCQIFDIDVLTDDVQSIQSIIEKKQQAEINKIKNKFSNLVNEKIEGHKNQQRAIFKLENNKVYLDIGEFSNDWIDVSFSTNKIDDMVATWVEKFARYRFYQKIEIDENMKNDLTSKLKMVLNKEYQNHFDTFLRDIIDELEKTPNLMKIDWVNGIIQCDKIIKEPITINKDGNLGLLAFSICQALKYKFLLENNIPLEQIHSFDFLQFENNGVRLKKILEDMQNSKINELKIKEDLLNNIKSQIKCQYEKHTWYTNTMEFDGMISILYGGSKHYFTNADEAAIFLLRKELEKYCKGQFYTINILDQKTFNELKSELIKMLKDEIKNHIKSNNNGDISKEDKNNEENKNNNIKNENEDKKDKDKIEIENINSYNTGEAKKDKLEKSENKTGLIENGDENKNQNEIKMKNGGKNNEIENRNKTFVNQENENMNSKTAENKIKENLDKSKAQTLDSADKNNRNQSETKNKGWIKFLKVLKWIALIGFILALATTVTSIFVAALSDLIVKFAIATVVLFCVFVVSKLLVSCLSNKQPKKNKSPYPNQIDTGIKPKENQNKLYTNKLSINQIYEQKKNNLPLIKDDPNK